METCLIVFAKVPRPGEVKTRLTPALSPQEAARLYRAFLQDTLHHVTQLPVDVRLYLAPPRPEDGLDEVPLSVSIHEQTGSSLGARMQQAFRDVFEKGAERALIVGTDHPTLPLSFLRQGIAVLQSNRSVCLGPTEDGGYYLLGMNRFYPQLFAGMSYSHPDVFSDTLDRVERTDAQFTVLPRWYDVDTPEDLSRMRSDLEEKDIEALRTRRVLERLALGARP